MEKRKGAINICPNIGPMIAKHISLPEFFEASRESFGSNFWSTLSWIESVHEFFVRSVNTVLVHLCAVLDVFLFCFLSGFANSFFVRCHLINLHLCYSLFILKKSLLLSKKNKIDMQDQLAKNWLQ
uniref:Uncharacterized protein n=1 Tax=Nelumbo nucifera TaxID=4432 RepID=A0A822XZR2_NELNU|nr:TPA_asm: hypothetical protein HUJ06_025749 [Nelumbo nucifera]